MIIRDIWRFADHVYCDGEYTSDQIDDHVALEEINHQNDFMKVWTGIDNENLIIAFRGSDDIKDWIENFCFGSFKKHLNFEESYELFHIDVIRIIRNNPDKNIIITGHSRGGAIATFCAQNISFIKPVSCVTFGCPKVGNKIFRDFYNKQPIDHTNVFLDCDVVANLKSQYIMGFRHVGKNIVLKTPWFWKVPPMRFYYKIRAHFRSSLTRFINKRWSVIWDLK